VRPFLQGSGCKFCAQRSKYFLIIIQADSQRFVFQFIGYNLSKQNGKFPYLDRRAIVPVKTVRCIGKPKAAASDGTELPDLNNVQGDVYYMFPKAR
jgi:hypothetical protein